MSTPLVSVIFPIYNSSAFLREAIESILNQHFTDFECIIINDGSTDNSEQLILSYHDPRIVYSKNEKNQGLIFSLNKGIDMARGIYIARMDGDDISMPARLEKQVSYLQTHPEVGVLATNIEMIDEQGSSLGYWEEDRKTITAQEIRKELPFNNCLAHPSIAGRTELFKKYKYNPKQRNVEDYDLWLRMVSDNIPVHKLDEVLLKYRILNNSLSRQHKNVFWKNARTKRVFAANQLGKGRLNWFIVKTILSGASDSAMGVLKEIKKLFRV